MIKGLTYRVGMTIINILLPPLAVLMVCGAGMDLALNCVLFLCAIIPAHIHGFYITWTYFSRRHKVKKGQYPGGPKSLIYSDNVINGGASNREVERLWRANGGSRKRA